MSKPHVPPKRDLSTSAPKEYTILALADIAQRSEAHDENNMALPIDSERSLQNEAKKPNVWSTDDLMSGHGIGKTIRSDSPVRSSHSGTAVQGFCDIAPTLQKL